MRKMNCINRNEFMRTMGRAGLGLMAGHSFLRSDPAQAAKPGDRIKIGQIGTLHPHAEDKAATLRELTDHYEFVGIVEHDADRRKAVENSDTYKGLKWMTEEQLLNVKGLRAVAVETAVQDLVPTAARCVAAGMHLHLDKPAGDSLGAFKRLLDDAARQNLAVQMGYMFRYNPAFVFCFKAVREGWLGDIFEVHAVMSKTMPRDRREEFARFSGGSMFDLGGHLVDAVVTVLGKPHRVTPYIRRTRPEQDDLADNTLAVFEYAEATATIRSAMVEVEGQRRRQFVVCGDRGTVEIRPIEPPHLRLTLAEPQGEYEKGYQEVELPDAPSRYDDQLIELARLIRGEKEPEYSRAHDLAVQESLLRACEMPLR
jgi:predicted dehydrogenase